MHEAVWTREQALAWLEGPERAASEDPRALWKRVGLRPGMTVVDVGAGTGYYALPASDLVGRAGIVYAVDVSEPLVELLSERSVGRPALRVVRSRPGRIPLADAIADRVLFANLLHGVPTSTVAEAVRLLRPGGRFVNVDWKKAVTFGGPPIEHRLTEAEAGRVLESYGLTLEDRGPFGPSHYVVVAKRPTAEVRSRPDAPPEPPARGRPRAPLALLRQVISRIPRGRVITYGEVAAAAGFPRAGRLAVWALQGGQRLPWHRVVAAGGRIALEGPEGLEQRRRLTREGVTFRGGRVRLDVHRWRPTPLRSRRPAGTSAVGERPRVRRRSRAGRR